MALSSIPDPRNVGNPFAGLPSAAGDNSLNAGSSLLGQGQTTQVADAQGEAVGQAFLNNNGLAGSQTTLQNQAITFQDNFRGDITVGNPISNPLANLVTQSGDSVSVANQIGFDGLPSGTGGLGKFNLDALTNQLGGGLGSGLNGFSAGSNPFAGLPSAPGENSLNAGSSLLGGQPTALGGLGNPISTNLAGASGGTSSFGGGPSLGGLNLAGAATGGGTGIGGLQSLAGSTSNITADISGALSKLTGGGLASGINLNAGGVAKAAGNIGNLLSLIRGANLPAGGELFQRFGSQIKLEPGAKSDWRVRITCEWSIFDSPLFRLLEDTGGVVWPYLPTVNISTQANYNQIDVTHANYPYYAYKNSQVNEITITGEFSAETETDAAYWIAATTFFRTATKMFFGQGENAGNPPIVCNLTGYGASVFDKVPVIVKSFNVGLNNDVNYVRCNTFGTSTWVPVLSTIECTLVPVYSRERLRKFNLADFAKGSTADPDGIGYL